MKLQVFWTSTTLPEVFKRDQCFSVKDIDDPVGFVLHFDEVSHLTEDFEVIASSKACGVHGFQYKNAPVWGVQFHPEYDVVLIEEIIMSFSETIPNYNGYYINELKEKTSFNQLFIIF